MTAITHILCPVDFSEFSRHAVDHAAALARWYEARLTVLYLFPNLAAMDLPAVSMTERDRQQVLADLKAFTAAVPGEVALDLWVEEASDVHTAILQHANEAGADLLVMGSHGRSGFARLFLGSVTERVIRRAPCPTLVVPARAADAPPDQPVRFGRILCPIDFSDTSTRALAYALNLAQEGDAELTLLHVMEVLPQPADSPVSAGVDVLRRHAAAEATALRELRALVPAPARSFCTVRTAVRDGLPHREILGEATDRRAELIVMGAEGHRALDELVFGSNTARVARAAACPVLIVPGVS